MARIALISKGAPPRPRSDDESDGQDTTEGASLTCPHCSGTVTVKLAAAEDDED